MIKQKKVTVKPGDVLETAIWMDGRETEGDVAQFKFDAVAYFQSIGDAERLVVAPTAFTEKRPLDDRVPPVPDYVSGPKVRLLVAEAAVSERLNVLSHRSFLADLDYKDLQLLRDATRAVHRIYDRNAGGEMRTLTDPECDQIIEEVGPQAALNTLEKAIH